MSAQQCLLDTTDPSADKTPQLNQVFPFKIGPVTYTLQGVDTIRRLISQATIYAMRDPEHFGDFAVYSSRPVGSTIRVGFDTLGTDPDTRESRKGLLLHECIHAMQDNLGATWMRVDTAEAAAYTAQCLFHRACGRTQGPPLEGLVLAAWDATEQILTSPTRSVAESDIQGLLDAIRTHPTYEREYTVTGRFNGITRPPPPPPRPSRGCSVSAFPAGSRVAPLVRILGL